VQINGASEAPVPIPSSPLPSAGSTAAGGGEPQRTPARATAPAPKVVVGDGTAGATAQASAPKCVGDRTTALSIAAYLTGFSNVTKLHGASLIPVSCAKVIQGPSKLVPGGGYLVTLLQSSTGHLDYNGKQETAPGAATLLSFGFMPTTATMSLHQTGPMTIDSALHLVTPSFGFGQTIIRVPLTLYVSDVQVNGKPLNVGPNCRTDGSLYSTDPEAARDTRDHVVLIGNVTQNGQVLTGYKLGEGGPLTGDVTIPPFTGCASGGDNLDSLLTSAISGHSNYTKQIQGHPCFAGVLVGTPASNGCTPDFQPLDVPKPER
jgi:hypothetical protein